MWKPFIQSSLCQCLGFQYGYQIPERLPAALAYPFLGRDLRWSLQARQHGFQASSRHCRCEGHQVIRPNHGGGLFSGMVCRVRAP
ncbi:hypothetical protein FKM82_029370 [Ascaphus truei]